MLTPEHQRSRNLKIQRLRTGAAPRVLELCSGCGGLSLGLRSAGFQLTAHVEKDVEAARTYAMNFAPSVPDHGQWALSRDMEEETADEVVRELGLSSPVSETFDVVAAGLPCQAFARIRRSKLRAVAGEADAYQNDARAALYLRFLDYITATQPLAIILENVPDILNFGGQNVPEIICEALETKGYRAKYSLLNAAHYGVPQMRDRFFLVAFAGELRVQPSFPPPTHFLQLPRGYESSRQVALKHVPGDTSRFAPLQLPAPDLPSAVGVQDALDDLPVIKEHWEDPRSMRRRRVRDRFPYRESKLPGEYAQLMRDWPGFECPAESTGHVVRQTPRDYAIFERMPPGADYPKARKIAEGILATVLQDQLLADEELVRKAIVPPYDPGKFPNKWWKLDPEKPARTLTAHMGKDTYSHIHYDSSQRRMISVREAARLQSFPDGFTFSGEMNASFKQIGNAVPPLLGLRVATHVYELILASLATFDAAGNYQAA